MNPTDRRVQRTQKSLGDALIALAIEKEYEEITIQEITDRADIGYRTFFRHYSDKDALLKNVLSTSIIELRELMAPPRPGTFMDPDFEATDWMKGDVLFRHVQKHQDLFRVLLHSERIFIESVLAVTVQEIKTTLGLLIKPEIPIEIIANHMVSATLALVRWWLDNDMSYSPEEMGEFAFRLVAQPTRDLILQGLSK